MRTTVRATGPARPAAVWDKYVRPKRWSEWSPQIRSVDYPEEIITAGSTGVVHGPCGVAVRFEIDEVDQVSRQWSWRVEVAGIAMTLGHSVMPHESTTGGSATSTNDDGGTTTTLVIEGPAPVVLGYAPLARIALERLVR